MSESRARSFAALAAVVGLGAWGLGLRSAPEQALASYLVAVVYCASIQLGGLIFLMIGYAMSAGWVAVVRPVAEALSLTLPLTFVLFLPVLIGAEHLYPWARAAHDQHWHELVEAKRAYLNLSAFRLRTVAYFALWSVAAVMLLRRGEPAPAGRARVVSGAGLPLVGLALTFAAFDWLMSLEPTWFSSAFGLYFFAGSMVGAVASLIVLASLRRPADPALTLHHYHALGRVLFGLVVFWAYIAYFQFFLIYIANRPIEVTHYVVRTQTSYRWLGTLLIAGHFAAPFLLLLSKRVKRTPWLLAAIAAWLLGMHYVDVYWLVMPAVHAHGLRPHALDAAALVGLAGACALFYMLVHGRRAAALAAAPELPAALAYRSWT